MTPSLFRRTCRHSLHRLMLLIIALWVTALPSHAFKMGDRPDSATPGASSDIHFGDPIHEDMARASLELARADTRPLTCKPTATALDSYLRRPDSPRLSHGMCCHPGASSHACDRLANRGRSEFIDVSASSVVSGVRWNDDPCHMTHDKASTRGWAGWMTGVDYMRFNNINYASHYHEKQFLHAMASIARSDKSDYREDARSTHARLMMWGELAFLVAEGTLSGQDTLATARGKLPEGSRTYFDRSFDSYKNRRISFLFTGVQHADEQQVRQMALGALMHTVQDSFSSSHVERERDPMDRMSPKVGNKGKVVRFHMYRIQSPSAHGSADRRPTDLAGAHAGDLHPVAIGAQLLACAAAGSADGRSRWNEARAIVASTFELADPRSNPAANAGRFANRASEETQAP